jgi:hypothetical protein
MISDLPISGNWDCMYGCHAESFYLLIFREKKRETKCCLECREYKSPWVICLKLTFR